MLKESIGIVGKIRRKIWLSLVDQSFGKKYYLLMYRSYWHYLWKRHSCADHAFTGNFLTAIPNIGAGIGHQTSNILAGMVFATELNLTFAYTPIKDLNWNCLLGLGEHEVTASRLFDNGFTKVRLPKFNELSLAVIKDIVCSYKGKRVVFRLEQDQFCKDIFLVKERLHIHFCYHLGTLFRNQLYNPNNLNVAIHVRRSDIVNKDVKPIANLSNRWLDNKYYLNAVNHILTKYSTEKKEIRIFLFSQGKDEDFREFSSLPNLELKLNVDPINTFIHLTRADILFTSLSSFSYIAGLYSKGLKVCPAGFWHGYPISEDWIVLNPEEI